MKKIGLLPCSGACNVGMISTKAVIETLDNTENTDFVCALGLPLGIAGIIANGKNSDHYIAVNGCPVKCATKALQSAEINVDEELVITEDFALQKNKNFHDETKLTEIEQRLKDLVEQYR